jgi:hypothetical protein
MRILCCGDRNWHSLVSIEKVLEGYPRDTVIIHGNANGADRMSAEIANKFGYTIESYPARWDIYGRAAGPIRNQEMLDKGKPEFVIAFHKDLENSKGTKDMVKRASKAGIPTRVITF